VTGWGDDPTGYLRSVHDNASGMQFALTTRDLASGQASADETVAVTTRLLEKFNLERDHDHDRDHDHEPDAELVASLRVYRNAAFAFRKLADVRGGPDPTLETACTALIDQGHHLLQAYLARLTERED
jgi:hypothetical protein